VKPLSLTCLPSAEREFAGDAVTKSDAQKYAGITDCTLDRLNVFWKNFLRVATCNKANYYHRHKQCFEDIEVPKRDPGASPSFAHENIKTYDGMQENSEIQ